MAIIRRAVMTNLSPKDHVKFQAYCKKRKEPVAVVLRSMVEAALKKTKKRRAPSGKV